MKNFDAALAHCSQTRDWTPNHDTLFDRVQRTYPILRETAANRELIQYGELADQVGTDRRRYLSCILDAIGYMENEAGRPPLSALVVNKENLDDGLPSAGLEELLENLGIRDQYRGATDEALFREARDEVWDYWSQA